MIHEEICTYEVCKLAKEKGVPQHITEEAYIVDNYGEDDYNIGDRVPIPLIPDYMDDVAAPTQSLLQRWLREEKGIDIEIAPEPTKETESKRIYMWATFSDCDGNYYDAHSCDEEYNTYELALEAALKYSLENLI